MLRRALLFGLLGALLFFAGSEAVARKGGPGPGRPIWPPRGATDAQLWDKAQRIQAGMWWHLSPEGLLVEKHRRGATPAQLSHDALQLGDIAIWSGCYAASQVCRWLVTHDPDARAQVRTLARGLATLCDVTGVRGRLARNAGRPIPGEKRHPKIVPSPRRNGLWFLPDVSRDQLAGVTLGWYFIGKYMKEDPDLQALARRYLGDIARRLYADGMWMRDFRGGKTKHGELRATVEHTLGRVKNGTLASIGLATILAAAALDYRAPDLVAIAKKLDGQGWTDAVASQHTFFASLLTNSNVNMVALSLLVLSRVRYPKAILRAHDGMRSLRKSTVGWWNAGICACWLLGGIGWQEREILAEIRATLHAMPEGEVPPARVQKWEEDRIVPIQVRTLISSWAWKEDVRTWYNAPKGVGENPRTTYTRADFLFAYWLTRAAGRCRPRSGPGASDPPPPCAVRYPPWMEAKSASPTWGFGAKEAGPKGKGPGEGATSPR